MSRIVFKAFCVRFKGNDDIYICGKDNSGLLQVQHAFSTGRKAPDILTLVKLASALLLSSLISSSTNVLFCDVQGNVSDIKTAVTNGVFNCSFTSRNPISTGSRAASVSEYFLMIAAGPSSQGSCMDESHVFHSGSLIASIECFVICREHPGPLKYIC